MTFTRIPLSILFILLASITLILLPKPSLAGYLTGLVLPDCIITITSKSPDVNLSVQAISVNIGVYIKSIELSSDKDPQPILQTSTPDGYSLINTYTRDSPSRTAYAATTTDDLGNTGACTLASISPWIQAVGDVHSNGRINAPGGP